MLIFWTLAALACALAALMIQAGARRGSDIVADMDGATDAASRELDALDGLKTRGLMDADAWAEARAEAGRRLLAADAPRTTASARPVDRLWVLGASGGAVLAALGLYVTTGAPGLADQPYAQRVDAWAVSTEPLEPIQAAAVIAREVEARPTDLTALTLLGAARFQAGDSVGAASAFRRALAIRPDDAQSWARLGESLVRSQDGVVGADAEAAFVEALKRDPAQLGARYFLGEAALARGDAAATRSAWGPLIAALEPTDPRRSDLERRMPGLAQ